jgi:hypothetical protein
MNAAAAGARARFIFLVGAFSVWRPAVRRSIDAASAAPAKHSMRYQRRRARLDVTFVTASSMLPG